MKTIKLSALVVCSIALNSSIALASSNSHGEPEISSLIWPTVNFSIYLFIIFKLYTKLLLPALQIRAATFEQGQKRAGSLLEDAEREYNNLTQQYKNLENEKLDIQNKISEETQISIENIFSAAKEQILQIQRDTERKIEQQVSHARAEIQAEIINRAVALAKSDLQQNLTEQQDLTLRTDTIRSLLN